MSEDRRIASLDGLRAIAVLAVVGTHLGLPIARGGGYGVDIFFVLSGFLITGMLLREIDDSDTISRRDFYARRALRLFPALVLTIVLSVIYDMTAKRGGGQLLVGIPAVLFYVGNWVVSFNSQALGFLGQTWSLAIEEQFYLLWPLILLMPRARSTMHRWLPWAIAASAGGRILLHVTWNSRVDLWTPFRADGLLLGALVAVAARRDALPSWVSKPAVPVIASVVVTTLVTRNLFPGAIEAGTLVVALCTAAVVAHLAANRGTADRLLALPPLVVVGRVSYGVYLYHYGIVLWLLAEGYHRAVVWPVGIAVTVVLTIGSWTLLERPALSRKRRFEHAQLTSADL